MNSAAVAYVVVFVLGVTFNLWMLTRLERGRRVEVADSNRRLDEVAARAAEAARLLASYHVQLANATGQVADSLRVGDTKKADKLTLSNLHASEEVRGTHDRQDEANDLQDVATSTAIETRRQLDDMFTMLKAMQPIAVKVTDDETADTDPPPTG